MRLHPQLRQPAHTPGSLGACRSSAHATAGTPPAAAAPPVPLPRPHLPAQSSQPIGTSAAQPGRATEPASPGCESGSTWKQRAADSPGAQLVGQQPAQTGSGDPGRRRLGRSSGLSGGLSGIPSCILSGPGRLHGAALPQPCGTPPRGNGASAAVTRAGREGGREEPPPRAQRSFVPAEGPPPGGAWLVPGTPGGSLPWRSTAPP